MKINLMQKKLDKNYYMIQVDVTQCFPVLKIWKMLDKENIQPANNLHLMKKVLKKILNVNIKPSILEIHPPCNLNQEKKSKKT